MEKKHTLKTLVAQQNVIFILALTFIVVAIWVGFSIYFSYSKSTITPTDESLTQPLDPNIDTRIFTIISQRKSWTSQDLQNFPISTKAPDITQTTTSTTSLSSTLSISSSSSTTTISTNSAKLKTSSSSAQLK